MCVSDTSDLRKNAGPTGPTRQPEWRRIVRSIRSMPSFRLVACAPILATLIIGAGQATASSTPTTGTPANQTAAETTLPIATDVPPTTDDAPADVPDAVTVVSQTPDGGLNVQEIPAEPIQP